MARRRCRMSGSPASTDYCHAVSDEDRAQPPPAAWSTAKAAGANPGRRRVLTREGDAASVDLRDRCNAAITLARATAGPCCSWPARCSRPMTQRKAVAGAARLRRPDPGRRVDLLQPRGRGALGAAQARWRPRPHPDRRGAGHQSRAMGDRRGPRRGILRRRGGAARQRAHDLRGRRRKQSIFSFQRADPRDVRAHAPAFRAARPTTARQQLRTMCRSPSPSARRSRCSRPSNAVFARPERAGGAVRRRRLAAARAVADRTGGAGRALAAGLAARRQARSRRPGRCRSSRAPAIRRAAAWRG